MILTLVGEPGARLAYCTQEMGNIMAKHVQYCGSMKDPCLHLCPCREIREGFLEVVTPGWT